MDLQGQILLVGADLTTEDVAQGINTTDNEDTGTVSATVAAEVLALRSKNANAVLISNTSVVATYELYVTLGALAPTTTVWHYMIPAGKSAIIPVASRQRIRMISSNAAATFVASGLNIN